jgi:hydroxymethylpyrimidine/phosphomethylpyrimidine kinase
VGFRRKLLTRCRVVTPNLPEFEALFGSFLRGISPEAPPPERLRALGRLPYAILLKGGHASGKQSPDWLWDSGRLFTFPGRRFAVGNIHGTGCTLASAIAANLAKGKSLPSACKYAKEFVAHGIRTAPGLGKGSGTLNFMG